MINKDTNKEHDEILSEDELINDNTQQTSVLNDDTEEQETDVNDLPNDEETLTKQIDALQTKCDELAEKNLRMMAEFDNFRRRTAREKLELQKTAGEQIFRDMLPMIDDIERATAAMQTTDDVNSLRDGVNLIYQKFMTFLDKHEVKPIETENQQFDTEYHEAITTFPAPTPEQKGMIIDCTQRGYMLADKVIRYAKVVVGE